MSKLKYYLKLYVANMSRSMISRMEYKNDLIIGIFGFFIQNVAAVLSIYFIIWMEYVPDGIFIWIYNDANSN